MKETTGSDIFIVGDIPADTFTVSVRNTESMIGHRKGEPGVIRGRLGLDIVSALFVTAAIASFVIMTGDIMLLPFVLPGFLMFMLTGTAMAGLDERLRMGLRILIAVLLIAAAVLLRKYIGNGMALIINSIFEQSEMSQAYVYDMLSVGAQGEEDPEMCLRLAAVWGSALIGFIAALPPAAYRRAVNTGLFIVVMILFAYLGVIPSVPCLIAMILTLLLSYANGRIGAALPILLAVALVFGAVVFADPGENYAVSRANENLRDMFALRSAYIEGGEQDITDLQEPEERERSNESLIDVLRGEAGHEASVTAWAGLAAVVLAIAAVLYLLHRRLSKRRKAVRAGLDSDDPNRSIGAMFPYAVRWLKACGISPEEPAFSAMQENVRRELADEYAAKYSAMLEIWKEAVYSDHSMTDEDRQQMSSFLKETMAAARNKMNWKDKLRAHFRYAL